ncbi:MAG: hypothetical protein AB7O71_04730 [Hyphomicrobiaceae bacterium]
MRIGVEQGLTVEVRRETNPSVHLANAIHIDDGNEAPAIFELIEQCLPNFGDLASEQNGIALAAHRR